MMLEDKERANALSKTIIGAALEVHSALGPGLLESAYSTGLAHELKLRGLRVSKEIPLPLDYKGLRLETAYRIDLLVENIVIVEVKAVDQLGPIHQAQLLTYLKLKQLWLGLLIHFNTVHLKGGIKRVVHG